MLNPTIQTLVNPELIDLALQEIQTNLMSSLSWLTYAYGKAERRIYDKGIVAPAVYVGNEEYLKLFPDEHLGCFSFFIVKDGSDFLVDRQAIEGNAEFSLVVWFDFTKVFPDDHDQRNTRNVIKLVTDVFRTKSFRYSSVLFESVFEDGNNIYKGFSDKEIENQFLMRPFGGFRLQGKIQYFSNPQC